MIVDLSQRTTISAVFYKVGLRGREAKRKALMEKMWHMTACLDTEEKNHVAHEAKYSVV